MLLVIEKFSVVKNRVFSKRFYACGSKFSPQNSASPKKLFEQKKLKKSKRHQLKKWNFGHNPNNGLADLYERIKKLPDAQRETIVNDINEVYNNRPWLAMVDSSKGITNLHVPSDVIVDASMPCVVRDSGKMWNKDNELEDVKCVIPDHCYTTAYQEVMSFCKQRGQFDVSTMGNVANVGLMAQNAEEYGSHDKTFQVQGDGVIRVVDDEGKVVVHLFYTDRIPSNQQGELSRKDEAKRMMREFRTYF
eukprot:gene8935-9674_t